MTITSRAMSSGIHLDTNAIGGVISDASDDTMGGRLSLARDLAGVPLGEIANHLGVAADTIQAWETDRDEPRPSLMVRIAGILGVSPMWLITGTGDGPIISAGDAAVRALGDELARLREVQAEGARLVASLERRLEELRRTDRFGEAD